MRLARPDVFHPRIVLAGCPRKVAGDGDDAGLVAALRSRGLHARWLSWDDPDTADAHLVILRAPRDYGERLDDFLAWTTTVPNLLNPAAVVAWNADRRYLQDLANGGVPTVAGRTYRPGEQVDWPDAEHVFVGPSVGTGSRRFSDRSAAHTYIAELHATGRGVLVQPGSSEPHTVLVFVGSTPSHAFVPRGDALHQGEADFEIWDAGALALTAAAGQAGVGADELLCARVELVGVRVLEVQLIDPSLGWRHLDAHTRGLAQRNFALAVESALQRLGLGPFSHRRP
ncbi:hypothetical protein MKUB_21020 [Mycobacterium kubicae]|uniref:ATP-grasp domain-containing protein n=1 Tax=Mycobacterium kubicae TaxID=120959 RepID=A0AAX1JHT0_9MYCO|nr:hypothetical protein [Mycobacterium kubicae]MCV7095572.1 hypothetical protein [Mycobacterium kubicae]ORV94206.1 hypothetical protein AWC13_23540 [Mycobacterium kubicae]QNI11719.1 hypothetical protein GAN18_11280 [Mycobacterium kubicae]QPI39942.1 hypothetical protein I2456_11140 [Mycobacterium kubicae]GFG64612.1 hypothetical protein MKUB_21020 [Mycobacterium kubicae]